MRFFKALKEENMEAVKKPKLKFEDGYVYRDEDGKWSFYDESNRPIGIFYNSIEEAVDAFYKYMELV